MMQVDKIVSFESDNLHGYESRPDQQNNNDATVPAVNVSICSEFLTDVSLSLVFY